MAEAGKRAGKRAEEKLMIVEEKKYHWECHACMLRMNGWDTMRGVYLSLLIHLQKCHGATYEEAILEANRLSARYPRDTETWGN